MSFDWAHFLDLAKQLSASDGDQTAAPHEAELRTAVSRAYYAAYHTARRHVETRARRQAPKDASHRWVWDEIGNENRREARQVQADGKRLQAYRTTADYDLAASPHPRSWIELAERCITIAARIHKLVKGWGPD